MKARVKATGEIVEVVKIDDGRTTFYQTEDRPDGDLLLHRDELSWVEGENADPDYWTRLEHQAAIAAMQGILTNPIGFENLRARGIDLQKEAAQLASEFAHALVEKMKESV